MIAILSAASLLNAYSTTTSYGEVKTNFTMVENKLDVLIETKRLNIRSVTREDLVSYAALFGDPEVMEKYATGSTKTLFEMADRINSWVARWENGDPFSAFAVIKKETNEFIGHIVLGYGDQPGQSEIAYLFLKNHWRQGYGNEAVSAIVQGYAPAILQEGYLLENEPLAEVVGTVRSDNLGSIKILENVGMKPVKEEVKFEHLRYYYSISLYDIINRR